MLCHFLSGQSFSPVSLEIKLNGFVALYSQTTLQNFSNLRENEKRTFQAAYVILKLG